MHFSAILLVFLIYFGISPLPSPHFTPPALKTELINTVLWSSITNSVRTVHAHQFNHSTGFSPYKGSKKTQRWIQVVQDWLHPWQVVLYYASKLRGKEHVTTLYSTMGGSVRYSTLYCAVFKSECFFFTKKFEWFFFTQKKRMFFFTHPVYLRYTLDISGYFGPIPMIG